VPKNQCGPVRKGQGLVPDVVILSETRKGIEHRIDVILFQLFVLAPENQPARSRPLEPAHQQNVAPALGLSPAAASAIADDRLWAFLDVPAKQLLLRLEDDANCLLQRVRQ
jgi:hypothetical protein